MKTKRPYSQVMPIAEKLMERLRPACERLEIAGSLRREAPMVGDIEIVAVPLPTLDLFGEPSGGETVVDFLLRRWDVELLKNGSKQKQFMMTTKQDEEYQVDLFLQPDPATWGVNYLLRTGHRNFSTRMVTPRSAGGYMPAGYQVRGARVWHLARKVETPEEEDVFKLWGMDYVDPKERK